MLQAVDLLVERYRRLKQSGATSVEKNSYLTKVHELEGMIQLSEAIPGANCTVEIFPAFVNEAYSLLRSSVIQVKQNYINFNDANMLTLMAQLPTWPKQPTRTSPMERPTNPSPRSLRPSCTKTAQVYEALRAR
ncbi:MCM DNA helicase complex subunit mcm6 [Ceratobasidium sp. 428]|nr:MCM DNA helicase complex subunit mcm6 [Ceratobasidium sp. 428]